jgi:nitrate/nitrite-specific signal transduction histidine kinase
MPPPADEGMGLKIMSHRAKVIGARFDVRRKLDGSGTIVTCALAPESQAEEVSYG